MKKPRLHLLGIPHTRIWHTHCAFTGKVVKFPAMMEKFGYHINYYGIGNDGHTIGASRNIEVLTPEEQVSLLSHDFSDHQRFHGDDANVGSPLYIEFNKRLNVLLKQYVEPHDIVLLPFGIAHASALENVKAIFIESGIGYPDTFLDFRIFESTQWQAFHQGKYGRQGSHYEWVIPNYFVSEDWPLQQIPDKYVLFFGRLTDLKGLQIFVEIAKRKLDTKFIICGQGDPTPYLVSPNIEYIPPVTGIERAALLGNAMCVIAPSMFVEPFCGVAVEAMLCGTPVITTSFGAFQSTVEQGKTGYRCHTLADFLTALDMISTLDRTYIHDRAHSLWSLEAVGPQYDKVFRQVGDLSDKGWYSDISHWI